MLTNSAIKLTIEYTVLLSYLDLQASIARELSSLSKSQDALFELV